MKYIKHFFTGPGALILLLCFFLPWISVSCAGVELPDPFPLSGLELASGFDLEGDSFNGDVRLWILPIVSIFTLLLLLLPLLGYPSTSQISGGGQIILAILGFIIVILNSRGILTALVGEAQVEADNISIADSLSIVFGSTPYFADGIPIVVTALFPLYGVLIGLLLILIGGFIGLIVAEEAEFIDGSNDAGAFGNVPFQQPSIDLAPANPFNASVPDIPASQSPGSSIPSTIEPAAGGSVGGFSAGPNTQAPQPPPFVSSSPPVNAPGFGSGSSGAGAQAPLPPANFPQGPSGPAKTVVLSNKPDDDSYAFLVARNAEGLKNGQTFPVPSSGFTIGRAPESNLHLKDSSVGRDHAKIRLDGETFIINDLASVNGTFIFDKEANDWVQIYRHELKDGDQIKLGRSVFSFVAIANSNESS